MCEQNDYRQVIEQHNFYLTSRVELGLYHPKRTVQSRAVIIAV
jgi:hypothetical protein